MSEFSIFEFLDYKTIRNLETQKFRIHKFRNSKTFKFNNFISKFLCFKFFKVFRFRNFEIMFFL